MATVTILRFGDSELDLAAYELRRRGRPVRLERIPMDLLILLIERRGELVSREEIVDRLWGSASFLDTENGVNTAIRKVRHALKDNPDKPEFILTVTGKGYRFIAAVTEEGSPDTVRVLNGAPDTPQAIPIATADGTDRVGWGRRGRLAIGVLTAAVALLLVTSSGVRNLLQSKSPPTHLTVAVLAFDNLTGDSREEYFADGLTEETITVLGRVNPKQMSVIARTSSMAYKKTKMTANQIGMELSVDYLLEGSVRRESGRVRVTVNLIRVRDQSRVWSETYDRNGPDVIEMQDELGNAIARQVRVELLPGDQRVRRQTRILEAYDSYLLGRHYLNQVRPEAVRTAIGHFETAVARDPSYALGFAGLAESYSTLPISSDGTPHNNWLKASRAAEEALRLDSSLSEAHTAAGVLDFWMEWNWARAEQRLRRAIELNPNNANAHRAYAHVLSNNGHHAAAAAAIQEAIRLDPRSPMLHTMSGQFLFQEGRYLEAIQPLQRALAIDKDFWIAHIVMGKVHERTDKVAAGIESLDKAYQFSGGNTEPLSVKGYLLARNGRRAEAEQIVKGLVELGNSRFVPPYNVALVYAGLGDGDSALQWLERAYEVRDVHLVFLPIDPKWSDWRGRPGFLELLKRCRFVLG